MLAYAGGEGLALGLGSGFTCEVFAYAGGEGLGLALGLGLGFSLCAGWDDGCVEG